MSGNPEISSGAATGNCPGKAGNHGALPLLLLTNIHTFYGPIEALKGIDIAINEGEIVSLIGSNGAGKSTTLMTISGILRPKTGKVRFQDTQIDGLPPYKIVGLGISQVPEGRRIFPKLSVRENLEMGGFARKSGFSRNLERAYTLFPLLKEREKQYGGTLSGGEQQMLAIGRALMSDPKLLLLDEPSLGLAPIIVAKIFRTIKEINAEGVTVLLVEQNANAALKLSHRAYVLESGTIKLQGRGSELLNDENIKKAYLGE